MNVLAIITARGGSKGLPRKNVRLLAGHPLIAYPIAAAQASGVCDNIFLTTDDKEIAVAGRRYGADVPFLRPANLAEDLTTTEDTLRHALAAYEAHSGIEFDICVFITATDIFRQPTWLEEAVKTLKDSPNLESVFSGYATHKNYWHRTEAGNYERVLPSMWEYSSRQIRKAIWREDTGLACASRVHLWRKGNIDRGFRANLIWHGHTQ